MNELSEAPASVTYSITSPNGFPALFTVREMSGKSLLGKMSLVEADFAKRGYKPQIKQVFGQKKEVKYVEGKVCPKCGGKIIEKAKTDGHIYFKCEKGGWDRTANKPTGCLYVDWNNPTEPMSVEEYETTEHSEKAW